jgi:hypothetical protein
MTTKRFIGGFLHTIAAIAVGFIPLWIFLWIDYLLTPEGFWQSLAFIIVVFVFGVVQIIFIIVGLLPYLVKVVWKIW